MLYKWMFLSIAVFILPVPAWPQELAPRPRVKMQRVSPKLLREAMATPEYKARVNPAAAPPSIENLQLLSDKLKNAGDQEGCDLLQRFIKEHQRLASEKNPNPDSNLTYSLRCQVVSVDLNDIPKDSILQTGVFNESGVLNEQSVEAFDKELDRVLQEQKAKSLFGPVTLTTRAHQITHFHQGGLVALPTSDGSPAKTYHGTGTVLDVVVTPKEAGVNRVELSIDLVGQNAPAPNSTSDATAKRPAHHKIQTTTDIKNNGLAIATASWDDQGRKVFLVTKVIPTVFVTKAIPKD